MKIKRNHIVRWVGAWILGITLGGLTSCTTWKGGYVDSNPGYLIAVYRSEGRRETNQAAEAQRHANAIAQKHLEGLTHGDDMPSLKSYIAKLREPIPIDPEIILQETRLSADQRKAIHNWAITHPESCQVNGSTASPEWAQALKKAEKQVAELEATVANLVGQGQQQVKSGNFEEAIRLFEKATAIDPDSELAKSQSRDARMKWASNEFEKVGKDVDALVSQAQDCVKVYHTPDSNEKVANSCLVFLDRAQNRLDEFRQRCQSDEGMTAAMQKKMEGLTEKETSIARLRGKNWGERIWLYGNENRFWDAYQYLSANWDQRALTTTGSKTHQFAKHEQAGLQTELRQAAEEILPKALTYQNRNAQMRASEGKLGLALVLLRMGQEMLDYHQTHGFTMTPDLKDLDRQLKFNLSETEEKLKKLVLERRILIGEFKSEGKEGPNLASKLFTRWIEKYTTSGPKNGPSLFCSVKMERNASEPGNLDYVLTGYISGLFVDALPSQELGASDVYIGREPKEIQTTDKKNKQYEQDVLVFVKRVSQKSKKASLRATVTLTHLGETTSLLSFDEDFEGTNKPLTRVTMVDEEINYQGPSIKTRQSTDLESLKTDPLPTNKPANLSPDRDITDAVLDYAADRIAATLQTTVSEYPVQFLIGQAIQRQKAGKVDEAADYLGQCLEYCFQLTSEDKRMTEQLSKGGWVATRQAISTKLGEMNKTVWEKQSPELKAKIADIWEQSVSAAQVTLKP